MTFVAKFHWLQFFYYGILLIVGVNLWSWRVSPFPNIGKLIRIHTPETSDSICTLGVRKSQLQNDNFWGEKLKDFTNKFNRFFFEREVILFYLNACSIFYLVVTYYQVRSISRSRALYSIKKVLYNITYILLIPK